jgi:hypothetical protein
MTGEMFTIWMFPRHPHPQDEGIVFSVSVRAHSASEAKGIAQRNFPGHVIGDVDQDKKPVNVTIALGKDSIDDIVRRVRESIAKEMKYASGGLADAHRRT